MEIIASAAIPGFFTALALIAAIGAQNAFIIRQGVARRYVTVVAAFCIISDIILITAGVAGAGALINSPGRADALRHCVHELVRLPVNPGGD